MVFNELYSIILNGNARGNADAVCGTGPGTLAAPYAKVCINKRKTSVFDGNSLPRTHLGAGATGNTNVFVN